MLAVAAITIIGMIVLLALHDQVPSYLTSIVYALLLGAGVAVTPEAPLASKTAVVPVVPVGPPQYPTTPGR
jgi:hypothetical protein